jgi:uncharacterized protein
VIYLDSCLVIYLVEEHPLWGASVARAIDAETEVDFAISPLVKCECLVGPIRTGNAILQQEYSQLFDEFTVLDMPESVFLRAAELRARVAIKLPDTLHLASAEHHRCDELWTNDGRLTRISHGMVRNILAERT